MAHIEASFSDQRFTDEQFSERMIQALTQAVVSVLGEDAGRDTSIILHSVDPSRWGYAGKPLG